jgi:alkanesulfonate monooxygenase SsuD/methylene tetrahydromethanopterin reductase-like flavin-dependent oxidoreductase (luciferase family)
MTDLRSRLGRYGVFLGRLSLEPAAALRRDAARIEAMGYRTVWVGEAFGREPSPWPRSCWPRRSAWWSQPASPASGPATRWPP